MRKENGFKEVAGKEGKMTRVPTWGPYEWQTFQEVDD